MSACVCRVLVIGETEANLSYIPRTDPYPGLHVATSLPSPPPSPLISTHRSPRPFSYPHPPSSVLPLLLCFLSFTTTNNHHHRVEHSCIAIAVIFLFTARNSRLLGPGHSYSNRKSGSVSTNQPVLSVCVCISVCFFFLLCVCVCVCVCLSVSVCACVRARKRARWSTPDAEITIPYEKEPRPIKNYPFKAWSGSEYSFDCFAGCQEFYPSNFCLCGSFNLIFFNHKVKHEVLCVLNFVI